jgi:protein ImuA
MTYIRADIITRLQKDILSLQGFRPVVNGSIANVNLGPIKFAFPNQVFPLGSIHEFCCTDFKDFSATSGFIAGILSTLMQRGAVTIWISSYQTIFAPALKSFGIEPDKIIFLLLQKEKDILWAMEEALKCEGLAAVIGEIKSLSFTASRRLQLAVEQSRVTGFIIRQNPKSFNTTACVSRWKITSLPSELSGDMPGVGFPRWNVELLKIRNGKPGSWQIEWCASRFRHISKVTSIPAGQQKKTG